MTEPRVGRTALALGFAGFLPQVAAVILVMSRTDHGLGETLAFVYAALIMSFLGGIWWGFAMRRDAGQASLAALAVLPSLIPLAIGIGVGIRGTIDHGLIVLGVAIILTLPVDRHLVTIGDAPANWMQLRVPLSLGLGGLTILAGIV